MNEYKILGVKNLPNSEVEIEVEVSAEYLQSFWSKAVAHVGEHIEIAGFRKGHIPENVLVGKMGEMSIVEESAEMALAEVYPKVVVEKNINAIGRPKVTITKMAKGSPLNFKAITAIVPEVKLPNYKKIAKEVMSKEEIVEITEKEVDDVIEEIRRSRAPHEHDEQGNHLPPKDSDLPEFNDEFVKSLGGDFTSVEDFKTKARERITEEKKYRAIEKRRMEVLEAIAEKTKTELPEILVESEIDKTFSQFSENLKSMGLEVAEYLKRISKTEEELRKEWRPEGEKRAKIQLVINQIALEEKISPTKEEVEKESKHLIEQYKDADPRRVMIYVETMLVNEKVLQLLESQK